VGQLKTFGTADAAKKLGISRQTLHRWFAVGRIKDVRRDHNNWRVFSLQDIDRIRDEARRNGGGSGQ
jgi:DNA-binding transcriptional MerR regulator